MATASCLSFFKRRRRTKSSSLKSPNKLTFGGPTSPTEQLAGDTITKSSPPGTIFTFNFCDVVGNPLAQRKAVQELVEPGSPQILLPIVVILTSEQDQSSEGRLSTP